MAQDQNGGGVPGDSMDSVLSETVYLYERYAIVFRKYVSRKAAGKGRSILEGLGLAPEMIEACFVNNPLNEESAVQDGLNKWREGHHGRTPTWKVLIDAMDYAGVAVQHIEGLKTELCQQLMAGTMPPVYNPPRVSPPPRGTITSFRSPSQPPQNTIKIADILRALDHQLDASWRVFGTFLSVEYGTMNSIDADQRGKSAMCMLDLVSKWVTHQEGTGDLPRTWRSVVEAVRDTGSEQLAIDLAEKYRVTLSQS